MNPRPAKLPDGKTILFTMDLVNLIDALLWEDEFHTPWVEKNLEFRYIADWVSDGEVPTVPHFKLILQAAKSDYITVPANAKDHSDLCREIIYLLEGTDPGPRKMEGEWPVDREALSKVKSPIEETETSRDRIRRDQLQKAVDNQAKLILDEQLHLLMEEEGEGEGWW